MPMPFDFGQFSVVAAHLEAAAPSQLGIEEGFYRSAIGRRYYRVYALAKRKARTLRTISDYCDHGEVWQALRGSKNRSFQEAGRLGFEFRNARNLADYDGSLTGPEWSESCGDAISIAAEIERLLT